MLQIRLHGCDSGWEGLFGLNNEWWLGMEQVRSNKLKKSKRRAGGKDDLEMSSAIFNRMKRFPELSGDLYLQDHTGIRQLRTVVVVAVGFM